MVAVAVVALGGGLVQIFPRLPVVPVEAVARLGTGAGERGHRVAVRRGPVPVVLVRLAVSGSMEALVGLSAVSNRVWCEGHPGDGKQRKQREDGKWAVGLGFLFFFF